MDRLVLLATLLLHLALPLWLAASLHRKPRKDVATALVAALGAVTATLLLALVGAGWAAYPVGTRWGLLALVTLSAVWRLRSFRGFATTLPQRGRARVRVAVEAALCLALLAGVARVTLSDEPVGGALRLAFPLGERTAYVMHGGASCVFNAHCEVHAQRHALDVVALDGWAETRAQGLLPTRPEAYAAFGLAVHAPCDGEVVQVRDGLHDLAPPQRDTNHILGNYVALHCKGATVLLAHLAQGSVRVGLGQTVTAGQRLARVGNTGNTTEPHLHIHAVRGRVTSPGQLAATGDPVPMLFDGQSRPLRRHDTVITSPLHRSATGHATAHPDRP